MGPSSQEKLPEPSLPDLKRFVSELKYAGMASLYLLSKAHNRGVPINKELIKKTITIPFYYVFGVFDATQAAGYIETTYEDGEIKVESVRSVFSEHLEPQLHLIIEILKKSEKAHVLKRLVDSIDRELP